MTNKEAIAAIDKIMANENPCNIKVVDGQATCRGGVPCCEGCRHLGDKGCKVKSVACKLWFCEHAVVSLPALVALGKVYDQLEEPLRFRYDGFIIHQDMYGPAPWMGEAVVHR